MWAQEWTNIYDRVEPYPDVTSLDVTSRLVRANYSVTRMFRAAESFFTSLGLEPMTSEFWNMSMLVRPRDPGRHVTCHGSAHDMFTQTDFRYDSNCHKCLKTNPFVLLKHVIISSHHISFLRRLCLS